MIEFFAIFYLIFFYFVVLAPKGTFAFVFSIWGYFMSVLLLVSVPFLGIASFVFVWICQRIRKRKNEGKSVFNFKRKKKQKEDYATKAIRDYVGMLTSVSSNEYNEVKSELSDKKQILKSQQEQIQKLLEENEYLKKKQEQEVKIKEATPRLRHYRQQAKKRVEQEEIELEKMKRKRLEEELRRLKNLDND